MKITILTTIRLCTLGALGALLVIPATGCEESWYDPRVFDDLKDETWVDASEAPGDFDSRIYGVAMAAGGVGSDGTSFFVAGRNEDGFANLRFDNNGEKQDSGLQLSQISNSPAFNPLPDKPLMVAEPGQARVAVALNAGGSPEAPERTVITMFDTSTGAALDTPRLDVPGTGVTTGLGFGTTNVAGTVSNAVILDGANLTVVRDIGNPVDDPVCANATSPGLGIAVGDLLDTDGGGDGVDGIDEIALASTDGVLITAGVVVSDAAATVVAGDPPAACFDPAATPARAPLLTLAVPADADATFGTTVLTGDINGGGSLDLVVTAPGANKVFVYLDLDPAVLDPTPITIDAPAGAREFGDGVAIGDLGGRTELIISAPGSNVEDTTAAGSVFLFQLGDGGTGFDLALQLHDAKPDADQRFGQSLTVAPFGSDRTILVVGADQEVFTYFRTRSDDNDVRQNR